MKRKTANIHIRVNHRAHGGTFVQPALRQHIVGNIGAAPENATLIQFANILDYGREI